MSLNFVIPFDCFGGTAARLCTPNSLFKKTETEQVNLSFDMIEI